MPAVARATSASGSSRTIGSKRWSRSPISSSYNTGISTYIWVLSNRKKPRRKGKVQLIDARRFYVKMPKSLGNKRNKLGDPTDRPSEPDQIGEITRIFGNFKDGETRRFTEEDPITRQPVEKDPCRQQSFRHCRIRLPQDHRGAAATPELPAHDRAHCAP